MPAGRTRKLAAALILAAGFATSATTHADITTVPTGLNPGASYRLVFVTSTTTTATDTTAEYYNTFVNDLAQSVPALQELNTTWTVMGNLNGANPWENTGTSGSDAIPIYRLDDTVFAANYTALKAAPTVPVSISELGTPVINNPQEVGRVWTGMGENMSAPTLSSYIGSGGAGGNTQAGRPDNVWYTWGWYSLANTTEQHLYAMSGVLTVPGTTEGFTVTFNSNGGSAVASQIVPDGGTATQPADPTRAGHAFSGWFSDEELTLSYDFQTPVTTDITLYADWTINSYTLTYNAGDNGTISGDTPQVVDYGSSGTAVTAVPDPGFIFLKWSDNSTNNPRTDSNVSDNITVTAEFIAAPTIVTVPEGLNPGDQYRLVFVSSATTTAVESDPAYYNNIVNTLANNVPALAALNTTWTTVGNFNGVTPPQNTGTVPGSDDPAIPTYRLDGVRFADSYTDIYDENNNPGDVAISVTEQGVENTNWIVWTGMGEAGSAASFGGEYFGAANVGHGLTSDPYRVWGFYGRPNTEQNHIYGISGVLTVGGGPADPYDEWAGSEGYNLVGGREGDDDGDGLSNFEEFAFGLDPTSGASVNPIVDVSDLMTQGQFTYTRLANSGLIYTVLTSTDLENWGPADVTEDTPVVVDGVETILVELNDLPTEPTLFLRVMAEEPVAP